MKPTDCRTSPFLTRVFLNDFVSIGMLPITEGIIFHDSVHFFAEIGRTTQSPARSLL